MQFKFLFILMIVNHAKSFDPGNLQGMNFWSKNDRSHADLTKCSLYKVTYDLLADQYSSEIDFTRFDLIEIDKGKCKNAPKIIKSIIKTLGLSWRDYENTVQYISESNRLVDIYEALNEAAHFDSESFAQGARRISDLKYAAIEAIRKDDYTASRRYVGELFHTIQDFYSHSNWVEFEPKQINLKLGKNLNLGDVIDITKRGCVSCATTECASQIEKELIEKKILTSGYFFFSPLSRKPIGKCSHGGAIDQSKSQDAIGGGINKDSLSSIHGDWHLNAANLAYLSTYEFLKDLWSIVSDKSFFYFLGFRGQSLVIAIDTTGSMQPSIDAVKKTAIDLIDNHQTSFNYILSPFNDPFWGPVTITQDKVFFAQKINELVANGGGDEPELYYHGLLDALKVCEPNSILFIFTDAPAKDDYLREEALNLALIKSVKINSILVSGSGKSNEAGSDQLKPLVRTRSLYGYEELATSTGGLSILSSNQFIGNISNLIITQQENQNNESLLLFAESSSANYVNTFYVDKSVDKLSFYISSKSITPSFVIYDPTDSSNQSYTQVFDSRLTKFFYLENPLVGIWKIQFNSADVSLKITCQSTIETVVSLTLFNESLIHPGYVETGSSPLANSNLTVFSYVSQEIKNISIDVLTIDSKLIQRLILKLTDDSFTANSDLITPSQVFVLKMNAWLSDGSRLERFSPIVFNPSYLNLKIISEQASQVKIGETFNFEISVENQGPVSPIRINAIDTLKLVSYTKEVTIGENKTFSYQLSLTIPNNETLNGLTNTIALSAGPKSTYLTTNQETLFLTIQSKNVNFDLQPKCVIVNDSRSLDCESKCSKSKVWHALLMINETGSGLAAINSIKNGLSSYYNFTYDKFDYSSKDPINVYLAADCCTQDIDVSVSDIYGNIDKCEFKSPSSLSNSLHSSQSKMLITILGVYILKLLFSNL